MVVNFNLTWKAPCLEILQYVKTFYSMFEAILTPCGSSRSVLPARLSKSEKPPWFGASGRDLKTTSLRIDSGLAAKLPRHKTISLTGASNVHLDRGGS